MKTYLFNCTTNIGGGATQNAANFVALALKDQSINWYFALSPHVYRDLQAMGVEPRQFQVFDTPSKSLSLRKAILSYERSCKPSLTYTMAGPAFVKFESLHVLGCSNPYVSNLDRMALMCGRSCSQAAIMYLRSRYQLYQFKSAQFWIFQTESSRSGFCKATGTALGKTAVVPNSVGLAFANTNVKNDLIGLPTSGRLKIFVPSLEYPHKALHLIPDVINYLKQILPQINPIFTITVDDQSDVYQTIRRRARMLNVEENIHNRGYFPYAEAPALYQAADLVFLPSILEVFSTSYLEAMACGKPLVVADRDFSREICGQAAMFAKPLDAKHSASQIASLISDVNLQAILLEKSIPVLNRYKNYDARYQNIINVLNAA